MGLLCLVPTQPSDCNRMIKSVTEHLLFYGWLVQTSPRVFQMICVSFLDDLSNLVFMGCWMRLCRW